MFKNIPKVMFSFQGESTLSMLKCITYYSFKEHNPDWKVKIFRSNRIKYDDNSYAHLLKDIVEFEVIDLDAINCPTGLKIPTVCDFVKYYILSKYGGLWSDCDILYTNPITEITGEIIGDPNNIDLVLSHDGIYYTALLMSTQGNKFFEYVFVNCKNFINQNEDVCIGGRLLSHIAPNPADIKTKFGLNIVNMKPSTYIPLNYDNKHKLFS